MKPDGLLREYTRSSFFKDRLSISSRTYDLELIPLGQGEYNLNYLFRHPDTGRKLVLRVNMGSQMHLEDQIGYEFKALKALYPCGRTPEPLFEDGTMSALPYGVLVMEWLPGRPLRYETDLPEAAHILADIHFLPVPAGCELISPEYPLQAILDECLEMSKHYLTWEAADPCICGWIDRMTERVSKLPLRSVPSSPACIINTELNSGNFLINENEPSFLIDWEKPLLAEAAQDLGHMLAPTTTYWKTDTILSGEEMAHFLKDYSTALGQQEVPEELKERFSLYLTATCLRGISWSAMALREYSAPDRALRNESTFRKIQEYLTPDFLSMVYTQFMEDFVLS